MTKTSCIEEAYPEMDSSNNNNRAWRGGVARLDPALAPWLWLDRCPVETKGFRNSQTREAATDVPQPIR